ncbi:MAG: hypothetical protein QOI13_3463, partial [Paraburkholderia sp.]|nr:hypothetical protein [Paraburkholderia sp.]
MCQTTKSFIQSFTGLVFARARVTSQDPTLTLNNAKRW